VSANFRKECPPRSASLGALGLGALLLAVASCAGSDKGQGLKVDLVFENSVSEGALASIDRLIVRSTEAGYSQEITPGHKLRRTGESFLYKAAKPGQAFKLDVTALAMGTKVPVACGGSADLVAGAGATTATTVMMSACAESPDAGTTDAATEVGRTNADAGAGSTHDAREAGADGQMPVDAFPPQRLGAICAADEHCESQFCARGVCCKERCAGACQTCAASDKPPGTCVEIPLADCTTSEPITEVWPLPCVGGGYNPVGDGPLRGSNRSTAGDWQLSLTIGDPSPACVRNNSSDPPCTAGDWDVTLGFAGTAVTP